MEKRSFHYQGAHLQGQGVSATFIKRATPINYTDSLVTVQPPTDVPVRVTGFNFNNSYVGQNYNRLPCVAVWGPQGGSSGLTQIRIDHCSVTGGEDAIEWNYFAYGVVDNCTFVDCSYGLVTYGDGDFDWLRPMVFGTANAVYAEDCSIVFDASMPAFDTFTDQNRGGRLVMRHCTFDLSKFAGYNFGSIWMIHGNQRYWTGNQSTDNGRAGISLELYNNIITVNEGYRIVYLRGGRTLVYNNAFTFLNSSPSIISPTEEEYYENMDGPLRTNMTWPAEDQVNASFFWGNTINGRPQASSDIQNWNTPEDNKFIQSNRDYFLKPPDSTTATKYPQPGSPSLPNYPASTFYAPVTSYTAFRYPHPLRSGASPTPTDTPTPTGNINIGDANIESTSDNNNRSTVIGQPVSLGQQATLKSLSMYVSAPSGHMTLGIYTDNGGKPGTFLATTPSFVPVTGWNTVSTTTQPVIDAGNYWLVFLVDNATVTSVKKLTGVVDYYSVSSYGALPLNFSNTFSQQTQTYSFYASFLR